MNSLKENINFISLSFIKNYAKNYKKKDLIKYYNFSIFSLMKDFYNADNVIYYGLMTIILNKINKDSLSLLYDILSRDNKILTCSNKPFSKKEIKTLEDNQIKYEIIQDILLCEPKDFESFFITYNLKVEYWDILFYSSDKTIVKEKIAKLIFDYHHNYNEKSSINLLKEANYRIQLYSDHNDIYINGNIHQLFDIFVFIVNNIINT
jgi:hypothetical protein